MPKTVSYTFTAREIATIMHGLRLIQENANGPSDCVGGVCEHFEDFTALTDKQIDRLCERINPLDADPGLPGLPILQCSECGEDLEVGQSGKCEECVRSAFAPAIFGRMDEACVAARPTDYILFYESRHGGEFYAITPNPNTIDADSYVIMRKPIEVTA